MRFSGSNIGRGAGAKPLAKVKKVLKLLREVPGEAADELASSIVLITMPDGTPVVGIVLCYADRLRRVKEQSAFCVTVRSCGSISTDCFLGSHPTDALDVVAFLDYLSLIALPCHFLSIMSFLK